MSGTERAFLSSELARKQSQLTAVRADLATAVTRKQELALRSDAKQILKDIEELETKLSGIDVSSSNTNVQLTALEQKLRKIDFDKARSVASKLNKGFEEKKGGCALLILQETDLLMGEECLYEMLSLVFESELSEEAFFQHKSDRSCKVYVANVSNVTTEETKSECLKQLLRYEGKDISRNLENLGQQFTQSLCDSLGSGDCVLIRIKDWHRVEPQSFLKWFIEEFWKQLVDAIKERLQKFGYIKVIAVLESSGQLPSGTLSQVTLCTPTALNPYYPLKIPLGRWKPTDVERWFSKVEKLERIESQKRAKWIVDDNKGYPRAIFNKLKEQYSAKAISI